MALALTRPQPVRPELVEGLARLEYSTAFDLAWTHFAAEPIPSAPLLALTTHPTFAEEAALRAMGPLSLWETRNDSLSLWERVGVRASPTQASWSDTPSPRWGEGWGEGRLPLALWASPQPTWRTDLPTLHTQLAPGALLAVLEAGPLGHLLPHAPGEPRWQGGRVRRALVTLGYREERAYGIGGAVSLAWAVAARLASLSGCPDLADRAEAAYRLHVQEPQSLPLARYVLRLYRSGADR